MLAIRPRSRLLLIEKRDSYVRAQVVYVTHNAAELLATNSRVEMSTEQINLSPIAMGLIEREVPVLINGLTGHKMTRVARDAESFLMDSVSRMKTARNWNLKIEQPAHIDPTSISKTGDCISMNLIKGGLRGNNQTTRYLVIAEGAKAPSLEPLNFVPEVASPLESERVTFYWNSPSISFNHPGFRTNFSLFSPTISYGDSALQDLTHSSIAASVRMVTQTDAEQNVNNDEWDNYLNSQPPSTTP